MSLHSLGRYGCRVLHVQADPDHRWASRSTGRALYSFSVQGLFRWSVARRAWGLEYPRQRARFPPAAHARGLSGGPCAGGDPRLSGAAQVGRPRGHPVSALAGVDAGVAQRISGTDTAAGIRVCRVLGAWVTEATVE